MAEFETDYLVVGAGATALAFVDTLLEETDAHIIMVDRRDRPGGHWNDAYPFVRLHQPSSYYGVPSRRLGREAIEEDGLNAGFEELATGPEVLCYLHAVMRERFLPSGRVKFLPMREHLGGGRLRHILSGKTETVVIRRRLVDCTLCANTIPLTHTRRFSVEEGVTCIPPNDLPRVAMDYPRFTILGAGKTGMDSVTWLLENGVASDRIRWVMPRDAWIIDRAAAQSGSRFYFESYGGFAKQLEAMAAAATVEDLADRMETAGLWMRLDPNVRPRIIHGAILSRAELEEMRQVQDVLRLGRVRSISADRLDLDMGEVPAKRGTLYVDCTASALSHLDSWPVFTGERIGLQMVRLFQPTFSGAIIARIEALPLGDRAKNRLAAALPMTDDVRSWVRCQIGSMMNQYAWSQHPDLKDWIKSCRLDGFGRASREIDRADPAAAAVHGRVREALVPALANMQKLLSI